jgi:hypothetical protein
VPMTDHGNSLPEPSLTVWGCLFTLNRRDAKYLGTAFAVRIHRKTSLGCRSCTLLRGNAWWLYDSKACSLYHGFIRLDYGNRVKLEVGSTESLFISLS